MNVYAVKTLETILNVAAPTIREAFVIAEAKIEEIYAERSPSRALREILRVDKIASNVICG